jgi:hypothetical protein
MLYFDPAHVILKTQSPLLNELINLLYFILSYFWITI